MKTISESIGQIITKVGAFLIAVIVLVGCGNNRKSSTSTLPGDPKVTLAFWQSVQEPNPRNTLFNRMVGFDSSKASPQEIQAMAIVLRQAAETCREKATQITALPLAKVDPDAAKYGVRKVQMLNAFAKFCDASAQLAEKQETLTDGGTWALDYIFSLARHADEGEEAWGNAFKEELVGKAKTFGNLQTEAQEVAEFMKALGDAAAELQTTEMQTRLALTQRYGSEFPTTAALKKASPAPEPKVISSANLASDREALMQNLIGYKITLPSGGRWTFAQMGEFQSFDAVRGTNCGDVVDYEVATHVKGWSSGNEHKLRLLMTYQKGVRQNSSFKLRAAGCRCERHVG